MPNSGKGKVRERRCLPMTEECEKQGGKCGVRQRRKAGGDLGWLMILPEGHRQRWHGWVE